MFEPVRGGTRGGQAEFKWSDVSQDKDREVRSWECKWVRMRVLTHAELSGTQYQRPDGTVAKEQGYPLVFARTGSRGYTRGVAAHQGG